MKIDFIGDDVSLYLPKYIVDELVSRNRSSPPSPSSLLLGNQLGSPLSTMITKEDEKEKKIVFVGWYGGGTHPYPRVSDLVVSLLSYDRIYIRCSSSYLPEFLHNMSLHEFQLVGVISCRDPCHLHTHHIMFTRKSCMDDTAIILQGCSSSIMDISIPILFCLGTPIDGSWSTYERNVWETDIKKKKIDNHNNVYMQVVGTYLAIHRYVLSHPFSTFRYIVKVRTDEYYTTLDPLLDTMKRFPEKIVTNTIFARKTDMYPYHPSDHVIAGSVESMTLLFSTAKKWIEEHKIDTGYLRVPEQRIFGSYIQQRESNGLLPLPRDIPTIKTLMKRYFVYIPLSKLGLFYISANSIGLVIDHTTKPDILKTKRVIDLHSIDEI